jgi:hypothetical protein
LNKSDKLVLDNVTLVCVSSINIRNSIYALWRSSRCIQFREIKLVCSSPVRYQPPWLKVEQSIANKLSSINEYSHYIVYSLFRHVDTKHVLLVQADGYVLNYKKWNSDFLQYDYIGAPWRVRSDAYIDPFGSHQRVGNGGFTLRSKKLLEVPNHQYIEWDVNNSNFFKHMGVNEQAEDGIICIHNRHVYEKNGCKFAPFETALLFSREQIMPENLKIKTFGFHKRIFGLNNKFNNFLHKILFNILYVLKLL